MKIARILFERHRATGVELRYQGRLLRATAGCEVILCLGAIQTPRIIAASMERCTPAA
jgi:choline dehydrogenase